MDLADRTAFVNSYTALLASVWSNDEVARRLAADPLTMLQSCGLELPAGSELVIISDESITQSSETLEAAISRWEYGYTSGRFELLIPRSPFIETRPLDDDDLDRIVGGLVSAQAGQIGWPGA